MTTYCTTIKSFEILRDVTWVEIDSYIKQELSRHDFVKLNCLTF
jgi:hypothetical protein